MVKLRNDVSHRIVTWDDVHRDTRVLVHRLLQLGPWTGIVALTRGGLVPAAIVSREMELRVIDTLCIQSYDEQVREGLEILKQPERAVADQGRGWLVIDDLVDTGKTARAAKELLPESHLATVYAKPEGLKVADTYVHDVPQDVWIFFPWDTAPGYVAPIADNGR